MDIAYYKKYEPLFGSWHIVNEIGEGSFGKVFEIQREDFGYTYKAALKAITIPQSKSEIDRIMDDGMDSESVTEYFRGFVQELIEEFRLMSKLKGESTVVSYEDHTVIEHSDGIGWDVLIRMELLTPLTSHAKENELNRDDIIRLGIDICKALELCRRNNIIHRDIKPENVFISENGRFKLGDFGIAKTVEKTTGGLSKKGTYTYMAPEVYKGEKYGPGVDIYSLGIMLYRYLNHNRTPFLPDFPQPIKYIDRETAMARRISGEEIPAPVNADAELAAVILKACAYKPEGRYSSPTEMREALEAVAAKRVSVPVTEKPSVIAEDGDKTVGVFGSVKPAVAEKIAQAAAIPEIPAVNEIPDFSAAETVKETPLEENKTVGVFGSVKPAVAEEITQAAAIPEAPAVNEVLEPSDAEAVKETPLEEDKTEAIVYTTPVRNIENEKQEEKLPSKADTPAVLQDAADEVAYLPPQFEANRSAEAPSAEASSAEAPSSEVPSAEAQEADRKAKTKKWIIAGGIAFVLVILIVLGAAVGNNSRHASEAYSDQYHDENGNLEREEYYDENGNLDYIEYYDENGNLEREDYYYENGNFQQRNYYENGNLEGEVYYDENGHLERKDCYDADGNLYYRFYYDENGNFERIDYYGENGNLEREEYYDENGNREFTEYYDENGNVVYTEYP